MTILVDTGVVYADHDTDAARHGDADRALTAIYRGEYGQPFVTDYVFDEAVTVTLARTGRHRAATTLIHRLRGVDPYPTAFELLPIDLATFEDAIDVFESYDDQALSFTDATSIAVCNRRGIDRILSFDDDFDGLVDRIDPRDI